MLEVSIIGGSGYIGGELLRILNQHPEVKVNQITSENYTNKFVKSIHPNFRNILDIKFNSIKQLESCDLIFSCLPHGKTEENIEHLLEHTSKIIDLSADFRIKDVEEFEKWYGRKPKYPNLLNKFVYGIPELHRKEMRNSNYISSAGCNATTIILALYPLYKESLITPEFTVSEVKVGSSEAGKTNYASNNYSERVRSLRSYSPTGHRHTAEIIQELSFGTKINFSMSATSVDIVRGILATTHCFVNDKNEIDDKYLWKLYRKYYQNEPFVRLIKEKSGNYRYPDPKTLMGSNFIDIGFEKDPNTNHLVILSAIDNLMKGAAGQAVQAFNIMNGYEETLGLESPGFYLY